MKKSLSEIHNEVLSEIENYEPPADALKLVAGGQVDEVDNRTGRFNLYYQWLACYMKLYKPAQVIELGAAAGISTLLMAEECDGVIYSVDPDPQSWRWMNKEYYNVKKLLGSSLDVDIPDIFKTEFVFIDSLHEGQHLQKELDLYLPQLKKGTVVALDDIHLSSDMGEVWNNIKLEKLDITNPCHYSGWGIIKV